MDQPSTVIIPNDNSLPSDVDPGSVTPPSVLGIKPVYADPSETGLRSLSPAQWRSGIAAWLGWLFDGLDMHLYTLVATPFVLQLLSKSKLDAEANHKMALIQGSFLVGWAVGGAFFGRLGDVARPLPRDRGRGARAHPPRRRRFGQPGGDPRAHRVVALVPAL